MDPGSSNEHHKKTTSKPQAPEKAKGVLKFNWMQYHQGIKYRIWTKITQNPEKDISKLAIKDSAISLKIA